MKYVIALLFHSILFLVIGQAQSAIEVSGGIHYTYRSLQDRLRVHPVESGMTNWSAGIFYNRSMGKKLVLKMGVHLARLGYKSPRNTHLQWPSEVDSNLNYTFDPSLPHEVQIVNDYTFLDLPILMCYELSKKKVSPFFEAGFSPSIFIKARVTQRTDLGSSHDYPKQASSFNVLQLVGYMSFGFNYNYSQELQLYAQPCFRYHISPQAQMHLEEHLHAIGMEAGIRKRIK